MGGVNTGLSLGGSRPPGLLSRSVLPSPALAAIASAWPPLPTEDPTSASDSAGLLMRRSKGPVRCSFCLCGTVIRIACRRRYWRILPLLYALSPTTRPGRRLGRLRLCRFTVPLAIKGAKPTAWCRWLRRQHESHEFPPAFCAEVDFGAEAPLTAAERFGVRPPFCPSHMLVGTDDRAIDIVRVAIELPDGIGLLLDGGQEAVPQAGPAPGSPRAQEPASSR